MTLLALILISLCLALLLFGAATFALWLLKLWRDPDEDLAHAQAIRERMERLERIEAHAERYVAHRRPEDLMAIRRELSK